MKTVIRTPSGNEIEIGDNATESLLKRIGKIMASDELNFQAHMSAKKEDPNAWASLHEFWTSAPKMYLGCNKPYSA